MISKPPRPKKCKQCRTLFTPTRPLQVACSTLCAIALAEKARAKATAVAKKAERRADKAKREKLKTRSDWMKDAQSEWNRYVRLRDYRKPCASCGATPTQKFGGAMDCSHYRSVGAAPHLRFHLHNAAAACVKCNRYLGGNVAALRAGLVERIGVEKVEAIERNQETRKFSVDYLKRLRTIFKMKADRVQKRLISLGHM